MNCLQKIIPALLLFSGFSLSNARGGSIVIDDEAPFSLPVDCSLFERAVLFESDSGFIRQVKLQGRYHGQWEHLDAAGTSRYTDFQRWEHRRFRTGFRVDFVDNWSLGYHFNHANGLAFANRDFISDLEDLILEWKPKSKLQELALGEAISFFYLRVGKFKNNITIEETISSNDIKTLERSHFINSTHASRPWGIELGFRFGETRNYFGISSNSFDFDPEENEQFNWGRFDHGAIGTYRLEFDLSDDTEFHFDYMYTDVSSYQDILDAGDGITGGAAEHFLTIGTLSQFGKLEVLSEVMFAANFSPLPSGQGVYNLDGNRSAFGFTLLPSYQITEKWELVGRYHYAGYTNDQNPQDNTRSVAGLGSHNADWMTDAHFFYLGLNYYLCGNHLKVMTGVEFARGNSVDLINVQQDAADYESTTFSIAVRTKW